MVKNNNGQKQQWTKNKELSCNINLPVNIGHDSVCKINFRHHTIAVHVHRAVQLCVGHGSKKVA